MVPRTRVFLVHGFNATPQNAWYPWLKQELQKQGLDVRAPQMPHPRWPYIHRWTDQLSKEVGICDERTFFIGHSLGGQAIVRYLAALPAGQSAGGAVFVGGFDRLRISWPYLIAAYVYLGRWLFLPIDWNRARMHARKFCAVFSDNDAWVANESSECFRDHLKARVRVLHDYGHFTGDEGVFQVPEVLDEILQMINKQEPSYRERLSDIPMFESLNSRTAV